MRSKDDEGEDWASVHYGKLDYTQACPISLIYPPLLYPTLLHTRWTNRGGSSERSCWRGREECVCVCVCRAEQSPVNETGRQTCTRQRPDEDSCTIKTKVARKKGREPGEEDSLPAEPLLPRQRPELGRSGGGDENRVRRDNRQMDWPWRGELNKA